MKVSKKKKFIRPINIHMDMIFPIPFGSLSSPNNFQYFIFYDFLNLYGNSDFFMFPIKVCLSKIISGIPLELKSS